MPPYTIMVIDDDPDVRTIVRDNLELDGYTVLTADTGKAGMGVFKREAVDLVILDLMLPDMDGLQVCRAIRNASNVSIIMLTAKDSVSDKVLGLEYGADDYLVKPFDYLELAARVKARLRRSNQSMSIAGFETYGRVQLNPDTLEVSIGSETTRLTRREFELMLLLVKCQGRPLSRDTIRREIWPDANLYKWSRTIDVHIQHLRAKLEKNPDGPEIILTVPGVGYMFTAVPSD